MHSNSRVYLKHLIATFTLIGLGPIGAQCILPDSTGQLSLSCSAQENTPPSRSHPGSTKKNPGKNPEEKSKTSLDEIPFDLKIPALTEGKPAAGKRTTCQLEKYRQTKVHHTIYLPRDFQMDGKKRFPVLFEYPGNGPYKNRLGDICTGKIEDCKMGFGISGGEGFIWVCLPFVSANGMENQRQWWGDADATVDYCKQVVKQITEDYQGDPGRLFLCGFSRGSIACNYIGLRDEEIASYWRGMICHSHYDGARKWNYPDSDREAAIKRLKRLGATPQLISHESSTKATRSYIESTGIKGNFEYLDLPFPNHTDLWLLKPCAARSTVRQWVQEKILSMP